MFKKLKKGVGDLICFLLNDLLNRELVRLNYKFDPPNFSPSQDLNSSLTELAEENENIINPLEASHSDSLSDDEGLAVKKKATKSGLLHNPNSRFTSATTREDEMEPRIKKDDIEEFEGKNAILETNIDPENWKQEVERVAAQLDLFDTTDNEKLGKTEKEDCNYYLKQISSTSSVKTFLFHQNFFISLETKSRPFKFAGFRVRKIHFLNKKRHRKHQFRRKIYQHAQY